jgi:hypothetical protein
MAAFRILVFAIVGCLIMSESPTRAEDRLGASPSSGLAPLNVEFSYPLNPDNNNWMLDIDFGDRGTGRLVPSIVTRSWTANHVYQSPGTHIATLTRGGLPLCVSCIAPVLGTITIEITR